MSDREWSVGRCIRSLLRFDWFDRQIVVEDDFDLIVSPQTFRLGPNLRKDHE